jgi:hypothetical protein
MRTIREKMGFANLEFDEFAQKNRNRCTIQFWFHSHFFLLVGKMYMSKFFLDLPAKGGDVLLSLIPPLTSYVWRLLSMASHVA